MKLQTALEAEKVKHDGRGRVPLAEIYTGVHSPNPHFGFPAQARRGDLELEVDVLRTQRRLLQREAEQIKYANPAVAALLQNAFFAVIMAVGPFAAAADSSFKASRWHTKN